MLISRSRVPCKETTDTPGSPNSADFSVSASRRKRSSSKVDAETDNVSTLRSTSVRRTSAGSALGGGKFSMRSTAVRTVLRTSTGSANALISTTTSPTPSAAVESTRSTPTMPETLSSMRRLMSSSTSSGDAPGYGTVTVMVRGSYSGKRSIATFVMANTPPPSSSSMSTLAATWLRAK